MGTANLISSVFHVDQKRDTDEAYRRLESLVSSLEDFDSDQFNLFRTWMKRVICQGLSEEMQRKVSGILEADFEVDLMISNLTETLREEYQRKWLEGKAEGKKEGRTEGRFDGMLVERTETVIKLLTKKFGELPEGTLSALLTADAVQLEAIIDNIFEIQSLEEVSKYLK